MAHSRISVTRAALAAFATGALLACGGVAEDAEDEIEIDELGQQGQAIHAGADVSIARQRELGLVTISTGCSGALLNRYWVLTARHCVTSTGEIDEPILLRPNQVRVTATWVPERVGTPTRFQELGVNAGLGWWDRDIVLIYLGESDLGEVNARRLYLTQQVTTPSLWVGRRLVTTDTVTQYGRGLESFATGVFGGVPAPTPTDGADRYRSAQFSPSNISETHYDLIKTGGRVGHGGDSGGPTVIAAGGIEVIAGVQSTCHGTYIPNAPDSWRWASDISDCGYVPVERFVREIGDAIRQTPECAADAPCAMPAIIGYVLAR